jgi:hypothetical protein
MQLRDVVIVCLTKPQASVFGRLAVACGLPLNEATRRTQLRADVLDLSCNRNE